MSLLFAYGIRQVFSWRSCFTILKGSSVFVKTGLVHLSFKGFLVQLFKEIPEFHANSVDSDPTVQNQIGVRLTMYHIRPFLYDIVTVTLQFSHGFSMMCIGYYELYWCINAVKSDGHQ